MADDALGFVVVPKEPTEAMLVAGLNETEPLGSLVDWREGFGRNEMRKAYGAMLAAATPDPSQEA